MIKTTLGHFYFIYLLSTRIYPVQGITCNIKIYIQKTPRLETAIQMSRPGIKLRTARSRSACLPRRLSVFVIQITRTA